jgi:hypothetical protein
LIDSESWKAGARRPSAFSPSDSNTYTADDLLVALAIMPGSHKAMCESAPADRLLDGFCEALAATDLPTQDHRRGGTKFKNRPLSYHFAGTSSAICNLEM